MAFQILSQFFIFLVTLSIIIDDTQADSEFYRNIADTANSAFNNEEPEECTQSVWANEETDFVVKGQKNTAILKFHTKFNGINKPVISMFIGTSPELEMALCTICFFAGCIKLCPISLSGTKFDIQTYKFKCWGEKLIGSAYPII